jgi:hypothetical protein
MESLPADARAIVRIDPYTVTRPRFVSIGDADALLSCIDHECRTEKTTSLAHLADSSTAPLFVSTHVYSELYRGCHRFAKFGKVTPAQMRDLLETGYLPRMRFVNVSRDSSHDPRIAEITDPNDVLTGVLASLVAPCVVFAEDKSLRRPGFAPAEWRPAAWAGRRIVDAEARQEGVALAAALPPIGVVSSSLWLGRRFDVPAWATLVLLGGVAFIVLRSPSRRRAISEALGPILDVALNEFHQASLELAEASRELHGVLFQPAEPPMPKQLVATVLARAQEPLLAAEVQDKIAATFNDDVVPMMVEVRQLLKESPEFTQPERYRWQLGYTAAALTDSEFAALADVS